MAIPAMANRKNSPDRRRRKGGLVRSGGSRRAVAATSGAGPLWACGCAVAAGTGQAAGDGVAVAGALVVGGALTAGSALGGGPASTGIGLGGCIGPGTWKGGGGSIGAGGSIGSGTGNGGGGNIGLAGGTPSGWAVPWLRSGPASSSGASLMGSALGDGGSPPEAFIVTIPVALGKSPRGLAKAYVSPDARAESVAAGASLAVAAETVAVTVTAVVAERPGRGGHQGAVPSSGPGR